MKKLFFLNPKQSSSRKDKKTNLKSLTFKQSISLLVVATLFLFGASGYYWYQNVFTNPDRVLSDMLDKSLQTTGIQHKTGQIAEQGGAEQKIFVSFSPQVVSQTITNIEETGQNGRTRVSYEKLGTQNADYARYTRLDIAEQNAGQKQKMKESLGVWGKQESSPQTGQSAGFLGEALQSVVLFGNLNAEQRREIKKEIRKENLYKYVSYERKSQNGRPVIAYKIELDQSSLVQVLKKYGEVTGLGNTAGLNPAQFENEPNLPINLEIDMLSRHLKSSEIIGAASPQTYISYNLSRHIELPKNTVTLQELQGRLQPLLEQGQ